MTRQVSEKNKDKIVVPVSKRPQCGVSNCTNKVQHLGTYNKHGYPNFRAYCKECHDDRMQVFRGLVSNYDKRKSAKCDLYVCKKRVSPSGTDKNGNLKFNTFCNDHVNLPNNYIMYRKDYCENIDGRLGFKCTTTIHWEGMLDVDHIDGNSANSNPKNFQTLCKCCHAYKGNVNKDYMTPGRKTIKEAKKNGMLTRLL